jgi:hypothetical protein
MTLNRNLGNAAVDAGLVASRDQTIGLEMKHTLGRLRLLQILDAAQGDVVCSVEA